MTSTTWDKMTDAQKIANGSSDDQELTDEQKTTLKQFRKNVQDLLKPCHDDYYLLRWLRAKKFDLEKAERKLREHFRYRKNMELDTILTEYTPPEVFTKYLSWALLGPDKEGDAVIVSLAGQSDIRGFVYSTAYIDQMKLVAYGAEKAIAAMQEWSKKNGTNGRRILYIVDYEGFDIMSFMDKAVVKYHIDMSRMYEANYPELLKAAYIINVPSYFYTWYNMVKGFVDPVTESKIKLFSGDTWKEELLKLVDEDVLPAFLGGKRTDPDGNPECRTLLVREPKIPTTYYLTSGNTELPKEPGTTGICIRERSFYNIHLEVKEANSRIDWYFHTVGYNIKFGVYFAREGAAIQAPNKQRGRAAKKEMKSDEYELVIPVELVESHMVPERGELICEGCGTYVLHFDNTFSVLTPKQVYYKAKVLPPAEKFHYADLEANGIRSEDPLSVD